MPSQGPRNGSVFYNDAAIGQEPWQDPDAAAAVDDDFAMVSLTSTDYAENSVRLLIGNNVVGTNKATGTSLDLDPPEQLFYGGPADSWGLSLTPVIVNASDFGVAVSVRDSTGDESQYLVAAGFAFTVPADATVTGVIVHVVYGTQGPYAIVDHIAMTIHFLPQHGGNRTRGLHTRFCPL